MIKGLKDLQESCIRASGGRRKAGQKKMIDLIEEKHIKTGKLTIDNISTREFFNVMVENVDEVNLNSHRKYQKLSVLQHFQHL